jgi:uncharacterized membrane protein YbhN (UPF0104 family)
MTTPAGRSSRGALLWNIFKTILALALIGLVFSKTDLAQLAGLAGRVSPGWLLLDLVLFIALTLIKTGQYHALTGREVQYGRLLNIIILQNAVSNFVASSAGIASFLTLMKAEQGIKLRTGAASLVIAKMGDLLAVALFLALTTALAGGQVPVLRDLAILLLLGITLAVGVFLLTIFLRQRFIGLLRSVLASIHLLRLPLVQKGVEALQFLADQEDGVIFRSLRLGSAYSLVYMAVTFAWSYCNLRVFSVVIPWNVVGFVTALMQLISWVPIQVFGGLGITETTLVYLYGSFGLPQPEMAAVSIGLRLLLYFLSLVVLAYVPLSGLLLRGRKPA